MNRRYDRRTSVPVSDQRFTKRGDYKYLVWCTHSAQYMTTTPLSGLKTPQNLHKTSKRGGGGGGGGSFAPLDTSLDSPLAYIRA